MDATVTGLLVRGGEVVDGTGSPARREDVRIADGVITEIGPGLTVGPDEQELDAGGATVAPGFIDSHTHFDPTLFWDPSCDPMPQHGVTTVLIGNCSLSLAPLRPEQRDGLERGVLLRRGHAAVGVRRGGAVELDDLPRVPRRAAARCRAR